MIMFLNENWLTIVLFVLAIPITVLVTKHFSKRKVAAYVYTLSTIQTKNHPMVRILWGAREIGSLYKIRLAFWNAGNETIDRADIPETNPPTMNLPTGAEIVSQTLATSERAHTLLPPSDNGSFMGFEYLNPGHGMCYEMLFTLSEAPEKPERPLDGLPVRGELKGTKLNGNRWTDPEPLPILLFMTVVFATFTGVAIVGALVKLTRVFSVWFALGTGFFVVPLIALTFTLRDSWRPWLVPKWVRAYLATGKI